MIGNLIDGKHLQGEELKKSLNTLYQDDDFKELIKYMQKFKSFELESLKVKMAYVFDMAFGEVNNLHLFSSTIISLVNEEQNLSILYNELPNAPNHYYGQILDESSNVINEYQFENEKVKVSQQNTELTSLFFKEDDDLPDNPEYKQGTASNFEPQSWWLGDGCLPGGYQHCGAKCGYGMKHGGGSPINSTDTCCIAHDNCWKTFGSWDSCCDKKLIQCVKGHLTVAAAGIRDFFGPSALRCLFG